MVGARRKGTILRVREPRDLCRGSGKRPLFSIVPLDEADASDRYLFLAHARTYLRKCVYDYTLQICLPCLPPRTQVETRRPFLYRPNVRQTGTYFLLRNLPDNDSVMVR